MVVAPSTRLHWRPCWRIIPTQDPTVHLFEGILNADEEATVFNMIDATSARARQSAEPPHKHDDYTAAPLHYFSRQPGRFTTQNFGAYYAAKSLATAIEETIFHAEQFMARTDEPPAQLKRRVLVAALHGTVADLRKSGNFPRVFSPSSYKKSQKLAIELRTAGARGVVYGSVRHAGGECAAVYDAALLSHCRQERTLVYAWNGRTIGEVLELKHFVRKEKKG